AARDGAIGRVAVVVDVLAIGLGEGEARVGYADRESPQERESERSTRHGKPPSPDCGEDARRGAALSSRSNKGTRRAKTGEPARRPAPDGTYVVRCGTP